MVRDSLSLQKVWRKAHSLVESQELLPLAMAEANKFKTIAEMQKHILNLPDSHSR